MRPFDFAIIGCGVIAEIHAAVIESNPLTRLVAAVDTDDRARELAAGSWKVPAYVEATAMLEAHAPAAAVVCTPPAFHPKGVEVLLAAGVHVLCEKPLATDSVAAASMQALATRHGRVLMTSGKFRFVEDLNEAAGLIEAGAIGRPVYYEITLCAPVDTAGRWPLRPEISGGGVLMDNGPHALDVLAGVLDSPIARVGAAFSARTHHAEVEDTVEVQFVTEKGTAGRIGLSWTYFTKDLDYLMVQGTEGGLRVGWKGGGVRSKTEREWRGFGSGYDKHAVFSRQLEAFVGWARDGRRPSELGESGDGEQAIAFIESVYSAESAGAWREVSPAVVPPSAQRRPASDRT